MRPTTVMSSAYLMMWFEGDAELCVRTVVGLEHILVGETGIEPDMVFHALTDCGVWVHQLMMFDELCSHSAHQLLDDCVEIWASSIHTHYCPAGEPDSGAEQKRWCPQCNRCGSSPGVSVEIMWWLTSLLEDFTIIGVCALLENEQGGGEGAD